MGTSEGIVPSSTNVFPLGLMNVYMWVSHEKERDACVAKNDY